MDEVTNADGAAELEGNPESHIWTRAKSAPSRLAIVENFNLISQNPPYIEGK
jgi:hypothetical protein